MSLTIVPESLNAHSYVYGKLSWIYVLAVVANDDTNVVKLRSESVTLTVTSSTGQLILVETATLINRKSNVEVLGNSEKALKIEFQTMAELLRKMSDVASICLDIETDSITVSMDRMKMLPVPE